MPRQNILSKLNGRPIPKFIGVHNLAQYYWCAFYSVIKSQEHELEFKNAFQQLCTTVKKKPSEFAKSIADNPYICKINGKTVFVVKHDQFVLLGYPDFIGKNKVLEEKRTNMRTFGFIEPMAKAQANLYAHFMNKPEWEILIRNKSDGLHDGGEVNAKAAYELVYKFKLTATDGIAPLPKSFKCNSCEYSDVCPKVQRAAPTKKSYEKNL